ncbi:MULTISPECIES: WGR domain-containing protein [Chelatococcus]|nr:MULTISPECIES: WGR domain-containing protein [Chelatococcus]
MIVLHRIDPRRNMARFYALSIERNLLGEWSLVRNYGRIGRRGVFRLDICGSRADAYAAARRLAQRKALKGYVPA